MNEQETFFNRLEDNYTNLTKKQLRLADYIRDNYKTAVFLACVPLAKEVGVSEATVIRLANALGYEGFTEMINHIREYMKNEMTTIDKINALGSAYKYTDIITELTEGNIKMLKNLQKMISRDKLDQVIECMIKNKRLILCGFEGSSGLVEYLGYHMVRAGRQVDVVNERYGNLFNLVNFADENTFVITIAFPRYVENQLKLSKMLYEKGANILAITDSPKSPLLEFCKYSVIISQDSSHSSNIDVYVAVMALLQILIFQYGAKDYENFKNNLGNLEKFNSDFGIFLKDKN